MSQVEPSLGRPHLPPKVDEEDKAHILHVITGDTAGGGRFRPSDWCDRLHGTLCALDEEEKEQAEDLVSVGLYDGKKCLLLDSRLKEVGPHVYNFYLRFARDNDLTVIDMSEKEWTKISGSSQP